MGNRFFKKPEFRYLKALIDAYLQKDEDLLDVAAEKFAVSYLEARSNF